MVKQDFSNAKPGDRVFSLLDGWGTVLYFDDSVKVYPVVVVSDTGKRATYTVDGKWYDFELPVLFHNKPQITVPEPPVTHEVSCFVTVYPDGEVFVHETPTTNPATNCAPDVVVVPATLTFQLPADFIAPLQVA